MRSFENDIHSHRVVRLSLLSVPLMLLGCGGESNTTKPETPRPIVTVAPPIAKTVTHFEFFTGRTEPPEQVEVRARVSGYLTKILFKPGSEVKKGDPLYEIDADPYKAELDVVLAEVAQAEARFARLTAEFARSTRLRKAGNVSQEDYDKVASDRFEAEAAVKGFNAKLTTAKLNLGYTKISAPISGMIGDRLVTEGNLIAGGQGTTTLLTTIVYVDKMDVAFDIDENTFQRTGQAIRDGRIKVMKEGAIPVDVGLSTHGRAYPLQGTVDFLNNRVDPKTGTLRIKAEVDNPLPKTGRRVLVPGMYARVRVPLGAPTQSLVVPESAFATDQGTKFLYVVGPDDKAIRLKAEIGVLDEGVRVVESVQAVGEDKPRPLGSEDRIIVTGLQRVRPGMLVDPKPPAKN